MSIKKILLSSIFLFGSIAPVQDPQIADYFFCNVPKLRALEEQKLEALLKGFGSRDIVMSEQERQQIKGQSEALLMRLMLVFSRYSDLVEEFDQVNQMLDAKQIKSLMVKFSARIRKDQELTNLIKNLVEVSCKHLPVDKAVFLCGNLSNAEIMAALAEYVPKNMDVVQICMEYIVWNNAYLKKQLDAKKVLTIDDLCYSIQQLSVIAKASKKSQEFWSDLVLAIQKGMKDLPQDLCRDMLKSVENSLRKPELEMGMKFFAPLVKLRSEIIATQYADQGKLIGYGKLLDQFIVQIHKAQKQTVVTKNQATKGVMILGNLIFKN